MQYKTHASASNSCNLKNPIGLIFPTLLHITQTSTCSRCSGWCQCISHWWETLWEVEGTANAGVISLDKDSKAWESLVSAVYELLTFIIWVSEKWIWSLTKSPKHKTSWPFICTDEWQNPVYRAHKACLLFCLSIYHNSTILTWWCP